MTENNDTMNTAATAAHLAAELGGKPTLWTTWLTNDRRPGRANELMPLAGPGRPRYLRAEVDNFIAADRARRLKAQGPVGRVAEVLKAVGIGEEGGSPTGRRLDCQVTACVDEQTNAGFVQLVIASPLLIFRVSPDQARDLAAQLVAEADDALHMAARGTPGASQ